MITEDSAFVMAAGAAIALSTATAGAAVQSTATTLVVATNLTVKRG